MTTSIWGTVVDGKVVPESILPEGAHVQIVLSLGEATDAPLAISPELQAELEAWQRGGAQAVELIERLPDEEIPSEAR